MRRVLALLSSLLFALSLSLVAAPPASAAPYCGITWGSLPKDAGPMGTSPVVNVRAGRHDCYDRLVVDLSGPATGYRVEYVSSVREDGSGRVVPLRGDADLRIIVRSPAYDSSGNPAYRPANRNELVNVSGYTTFRQVAWAGSFEGQTTVGLGVRARLPFRAFFLSGSGGTRLVVDVAHRW